MKIITIPFSELERYRKGEKSSKIQSVLNEINHTLPVHLKEEVKYREIKFDYYAEPLAIPHFTIPFCFSACNASKNLKQFLNKFVILVKWDRQNPNLSDTLNIK